MKRYIFLICIVFACNNINAQLFEKPFYSKGKIITKSDTIDCYIRNELVYKGKITYKLDTKIEKPLTIDVSEIERIYTSNYHYGNVKVGKKSFFMKLITTGEITLYKYDYFTNTNPPTHKSTRHLTGVHSKIRRKLYLVKDDITFKVNKRKLHENLKKLMIDDTDVHADIKKLNYRDVLFEYHLKNLIVKYNKKKKYK